MIDTATSEEIRALLKEEGFADAKINLADGTYAIPTTKAIEEFGKRFGQFLWGAGLDNWVNEIWDCDDFALTAKSLADIDNAVWQNKTGNHVALGFGIVWVELEDGGGHAINIALGRDTNGKLILRYFEPQLQVNTENKVGEPNVWLQEKSRNYFLLPLWCYF